MTGGPANPGPSLAGAYAAQRRAELSGRLLALRERLAAACAAAGRPAGSVTVVAVTKTFPATDVHALAGLGITDFGENRDQEAAAKARACSGLAVRWHFVGQVQTNKARSVASYAHVVHSVDRVRLVRALDRAAREAGRRLDCLVQVDLDPRAGIRPDTQAGRPPARGGALPADVPAIAEALAGTEALDLRGVMAVAPLGLDPAGAFGRLAAVAAALRRIHPAATVISAGMSGDLEAAIAAGATHVRVGSALLGNRPPLG